MKNLRRLTRAFSLTELMIAVAVLAVVIIATGRIFGTVSKVTSLGTAGSDVLQEAAAIERQIREDFERLSYDGVFAIQANAVRNDINVASGGPLLNPSLPLDAIIRADQLLFFTNGLQSNSTLAIGATTQNKGQATIARIYYGHAFQLPLGRPFGALGANLAHDPNELWAPWRIGLIQMATTTFTSGATSFARGSAGELDGTQPEARKWLLARQPVLMVDDDMNGPGDDSKSVYFFENGPSNISSKSIYTVEPVTGIQTYQIQNGRVDAAATQLNDLRAFLIGNPASPNAWNPVQRNLIGNRLLYFPRAERFAPGPSRVDQALTNHVISSGCSSFIVEWTYDDAVGAAVDAAGTAFIGVQVDPRLEQPWFGLTDFQRSVRPYFEWSSATGQGAASIPNANNIDQQFNQVIPGWDVYQAFFGFNQQVPLNGNGVPDNALGYTPWPTAVRITMVLHDPATKLESGRTFQFLVRLPRPRG